MTGYTVGFSGLLSSGQGGTLEIAGRIPGATHYSHRSWRQVLKDIIALDTLGKLSRPLCLFGHSMGAEAVLEICAGLRKIGIEVDYAGIIDLTLGPVTSAENNIKLLQEFHSQFQRVKFHDFQGVHELYELDDIMDDNIGHSEAARLDFTQDKIVETIAMLTKGEPVSKDRFYKGEGKRISDKDFAVLSAKHQIPQYLLRAVVEVEARQKGSHSSGALVFRYELHKAYQYSKGPVRDALVNAGLASPSYKVALNWDHANSYPHLEQAAAIAGEEIACLASSWGMGQIMGFNHNAVGFDTALEMVTNFAQSEANQVEGMVAFIKSEGLLDDLMTGNWKGFAAGYNGKSYATNQYDVKLWQAAEKWRRKIGEDIDVISVPVPTHPEQPKPPVIDDMGGLEGARTTLEQYFPDLNPQNRELVLALAMVLGKTPEPPPKINQIELPTNPPTEAGFSLPQTKGLNQMEPQGFIKSKAFFKSKRFWGLATILVGTIFPTAKPIVDIITPTVTDATPELLTELQAQSVGFVEWVKEGVRYAGIALTAFGSWKAEHKLTLK